MLEPGGRICVNVANLGRRPYRSLSADVIGILQDDLRPAAARRGHLGEGGGAGSCAWGSSSARNPVLRDVTERSSSPARAVSAGLAPREGTAQGEAAVRRTTHRRGVHGGDARRLALPARERRARRPSGAIPRRATRALIRLFTYKGDLVLDPFLGAGQPRSQQLEPGGITSATNSTLSTQSRHVREWNTQERNRKHRCNTRYLRSPQSTRGGGGDCHYT